MAGTTWDSRSTTPRAAAAETAHIDRVNQNQGAESTLAFLLSLAEMRRAQDAMSSLEQSLSLAEPLVRPMASDLAASPAYSPAASSPSRVPAVVTPLMRTAS